MVISVKVRIEDFSSQYVPELRIVFFTSIHFNASGHYSEEQLNAWAPKEFDNELWESRIEKLRPFLAFIEDLLVGYADVQNDGYIDHFFVRGGFAGAGIGTALMVKILEVAREKRLDRLYSEVSLAAQRMFERNGFQIVQRQKVVKQGIELENAIMERIIKH